MRDVKQRQNHWDGARMRSSSVQGRPQNFDNTGRGPQRRRYNSTSKQSDDGSSWNGDRVNYGEQLYKRGMKNKEERQRMVQRARSERDQLEMDEYTFKPEIN